MEEDYTTLLIGICVTIFFIVIIWMYVSSPGNESAWSEWVLVGEEPTCGAGSKKYVRQCTLNSVAQAVSDSCVSAFGGSDTKTEEYVFPNNCPIKGRFVRIERNATSGQPGAGDTLNVAEIKVFDADGNSLIKSNTTATAGSLYIPAFSADKLIDGDLGNVAQTSASDKVKNWFQIDLGSDMVIAKVDVYNSAVCCTRRLAGARILITNAVGDVVFTSPDITPEQAINPSKVVSFSVV